MKIRVVSNRTEIYELDPSEKYIHLAFRPSVRDFFVITDKCPKLEIIQLPHSYMTMLAKSLNSYFHNQHIQVIEGAVWGHRKDLNEYFDIPDEIRQTMRDQVISDVSMESIIKEASKKYVVSEAMASLILLDVKQELQFFSAGKPLRTNSPV